VRGEVVEGREAAGDLAVAQARTVPRESDALTAPAAVAQTPLPPGPPAVAQTPLPPGPPATAGEAAVTIAADETVRIAAAARPAFQRLQCWSHLSWGLTSLQKAGPRQAARATVFQWCRLSVRLAWMPVESALR
jgi:hypothetical protein